MSRVAFPTGQEIAQRLWLTDTFEWGLWQPDTAPDPSSQIFVDDLDGTEVAAAGRIAVTPGATTITQPPTITADGFIIYNAADPDFGTPGGNEVAAWLVLYRLVTTDADSEIVAVFAVGHLCDGIEQAIFPLSTFGALAIATQCTSAF